MRCQHPVVYAPTYLWVEGSEVGGPALWRDVNAVLPYRDTTVSVLLAPGRQQISMMSSAGARGSVVIDVPKTPPADGHIVVPVKLEIPSNK